MKPILRPAWLLGAALLTVALLAQPLTAQPRIRMNNTTVQEGNAGSQQVDLAIQLSEPASATVTVDYAIGANSPAATTGASCGGAVDLVHVPGTVILVPVCFDFPSSESPETFIVTLSSPVNATIASATGTATINE